MPYPIGFNALANNNQVGDESYYLDTCKRLGSAFQLVMSNPQLASKLYDTCNGQTEVIYRSYSSDDNTLWRFRSAQTYGEELIAFKDQRLWLYGLNEPNGKDSNEVAYRNQWLADLIEYVCGGYGRKLVVGNFASGSWNLNDIDAGLYDNLLRTIHKYRHICYLGLHEYSAILMPMTFKSIVNGLKDREDVLPSEWLYLDSYNPATALPDYRKERINWYYHLFRSNWLQHRCKTIGIKPVPIVLTEYGTDRLQDVDGQNGIYEYFKNFAGVPEPYAAPHGFYSNYKVWEWYYPNWDVSESLFYQLKWSYMNYTPEWYKGILLFDWGYDTEFASRGFNVAPDKKLHNLLIDDSIAYRNQPETEPEQPPMPTTIDTLDYIKGDGHLYELYANFGDYYQGISHVKTENTVDRRFFHVKGHKDYPNLAQWEEFWYDDNHIWRGTDTSPNETEIYQISRNAGILEGGQYGERWIPRRMSVGERFHIESWVTFRKKSDGQPVPSKPAYLFRHSIQLKQIHPSYQFTGGVVLNDVIELWGYLDDGRNFERYFYAKGYGLVAWIEPSKNPNWISYVSQPFVSGNLIRHVPSWLTLPALPPIQPKPDPTPEDEPMVELNDPRWKPQRMIAKVLGKVNIRKAPSTAASIMGVFQTERPVYTLSELNENKSDGIWQIIRFDAETGATYNADDFDLIGYVRNDVARFEDYPEPEPEPEPEPQPLPDKYFKYFVPKPELVLTPEKAQQRGEMIRWMTAQFAGIPSQDVHDVIADVGWIADLLVNWHTLPTDYDGLVLIPENDE